MGTDYLEQVRKKITYIRPYGNEGFKWYNEGMTLLKSGQFEAAELKFKELIMSQPEHLDGYNGLALVYQKLGRKNEAVFFMQEAIVRAKVFLDEGTLDQAVLDRLEQDLKQIQQM